MEMQNSFRWCGFGGAVTRSLRFTSKNLWHPIKRFRSGYVSHSSCAFVALQMLKHNLSELRRTEC
jgi:hypothetical protein